MYKVVPHLWFDKEAREAAEFYTDIFENSKILNTVTLKDTPSGDSEIVSLQLEGQPFESISAGPYFKFNPSISFMVNCSTKEEVDKKYKALSEGGEILMPLDSYPFSEWYVWLKDKYGLSWQLTLMPEEKSQQKIRPVLLFSGDVCGKAEEAINHYRDVFKNSETIFISKYNPGDAPAEEAKINFGAFKLEGFDMVAMDNGMKGDFTFNEAISFIVNCNGQEEIDYYWDKLSAVPEAEECGWLKDKFGLSWQIVPDNMSDILFNGTEDVLDRLTKAFLQMKKLDLTELERARKG